MIKNKIDNLIIFFIVSFYLFAPISKVHAAGAEFAASSNLMNISLAGLVILASFIFWRLIIVESK